MRGHYTSRVSRTVCECPRVRIIFDNTFSSGYTIPYVNKYHPSHNFSRMIIVNTLSQMEVVNASGRVYESET